MMRAFVLSIMLSVVGASAWTTVSASPQPPIRHSHSFKSTWAQSCSLPPGWEKIAARRPRFVVLGEMHGTQQAPAFVGDLACALASRGERILVAVEHSSTENDAWQTAWKHSESEFTSAIKHAGWAGRQDGVASQAMLDLVARLHGLSRRGQLIDIVAFNGAKDEAQASRFSYLPGQGPHEAAQAENVRAAAAARPYDHVLVLIGNLHARKRPVDRSGTAFEPMAMQLGPPATVMTLEMKTAGGSAWNCQLKPGVKLGPKEPIADDAIACASYPLRGEDDLKREPFVELNPFSGSVPNTNYDGIFWLGKVSASPPAIPNHSQSSP